MEALDLLLVHAAATWGLVGLIWTVQLVQYPGFALVGAPDFSRFHEHHCNRIVWIVAPLMALELLTGIALIWETPAGLTGFDLSWGLGLIALNWVCTAFVSVPLHGRLRPRGHWTIRTLVATNWVRTAAWSARGVWVLFVLQASGVLGS